MPRTAGAHHRGACVGAPIDVVAEVAPEVREAGGVYVDEAIVEDGQSITAREPGDTPIQMRRIFEIIAANQTTGER